MRTRNTTCYYGLLVDCLKASNYPDCRLCAERLVNAMTELLRPASTDTGANGAESDSPYNDAVREHASQLAEAIATRVKEHRHKWRPA
jgi:hypothetical protein